MRTLRKVLKLMSSVVRAAIQWLSSGQDEVVFSEEARIAAEEALRVNQESILSRGRFLEVFRATGLAAEEVRLFVTAEPAYEKGRLKLKVSIPPSVASSNCNWGAVQITCDQMGLVDIIPDASGYMLVEGFVGTPEECAEYLKRRESATRGRWFPFTH